MFKGLKWGTVAGFAVIALMSGGIGVLAQADKEAIIKQRQMAMKGQGQAMASVKGYLEGKNDIDKAKEGANTIASTAPKIPELFPPGSGMAEFPGKSGAKGAIWSEWDKFLASQKMLVDESQKLVQAVNAGDKGKIGDQFAAVGKNGCGNCHNTYREKLN